MTAKYVKPGFLNKPALAAALGSFGFWFVTLVYLEAVLHYTVFGDFSVKFLYAVGFDAMYAAVLAAITTLVPRKANFAVNCILTVVVIFLYGSQMVYNFVFGTLYSVALIEQGGQAVTSFWRELLVTMRDNALDILPLGLPLVAVILLRRFCRSIFDRTNWVFRVGLVCVAVVAGLVVPMSLRLGGTGIFSDYYYYHSDSVATNQTASRFGLPTAFRLELFGTLGGSGAEGGYYVAKATEPAADAEDSEEVPEETIPPVEYNVLDIDWDALSQQTEDEVILALNDYCAQLTGTNKNEYTGMLSDYNLIVLCAESFATGAIDPELTPTLYKLANEGIVFTNYYNSYPNTTTDGEYSLCMGLFPDTTRNKRASSLYASRNSYLPFCLGNIFNEQKGIASYGYHNYKGYYYGRDESHPNMGYQMKFAWNGMTFTTEWPASDDEMMQQSVDDYINSGEQFNAYYMTFSGHYRYTYESNYMARRNWDLVKNLDYSSEAIKCYLSCNIELEKGMAYLMQRLEEAGIADKTAIVLAGDHFPYGLTDEQYSELIGYDIDAFSKYKSTLIFWVGGLEENIVVDEYCCNVDILPTILNLWGFDYDSRMLAGTDVFSDGEHMAILINKSFLTDKVWFNADTNEIRYLVDESEIPEGYVENLINQVFNKFSISSDILNKAYYNYVFGKESVTLDMANW